MTSPLVFAAIGAASALTTLAGGALALKLASRTHLILGFSAGAVVGVALLDLLPESLQVGGTGASFATAGLVAVGFFAYLVVGRTASSCGGDGGDHPGHFGPAALTAHSLLDGLGIGLALSASLQLGVVVAAAVLAHDLADGVNTVSLSLQGSGSRRWARGWLAADAAAPAAGLALSRTVHLSPKTLGEVLALFCGAFLYLGASQLAPESYRKHPRPWTTVSTGLGLGAIWLAVWFARSG